MHFSLGKIWFDIFPPCNQNDFVKLWTDTQLAFYWYSFDLKIILLNISSIAKSEKSMSDLSVSLVIEIFLCCIRQLELISKYLQWLHLIRYLQFVFLCVFQDWNLKQLNICNVYTVFIAKLLEWVLRKGILRKGILWKGILRKGILEGQFRNGVREGHFRKGI